MKNLIVSLFTTIFLFGTSVFSQELWGTTPFGGSHNTGTIFSIDVPSGTGELKHDFAYMEGFSPGTFAQSNDGKLYATTKSGASMTVGTIVRIDSTNYEYSVVYHFSDSTGTLLSDLAFDPNQNLFFGTSETGGSDNNGILYAFDPLSNETTTLHIFDTSAYFPTGKLVIHPNGKLYGMTKGSGTTYRGMIYSYEYNTNTYTNLFEFADSLGGSTKNYTLFSDGFIYGTSYFYGAHYEGTIFRYNIESNELTKLYDFSDSTGKFLKSPPLEASNGKLYGTCYNGGENYGGTLYEYDIETGQFELKHQFDYYSGFVMWYLSEPFPGLIIGATNLGGDYGRGYIYGYNFVEDTLNILYSLNNNVGYSPSGPLWSPSAGKLLCSTAGGSSFHYGSLFELDLNTTKANKLYEFYGFNEFHQTIGGLVYLPKDGYVYGLSEMQYDFMHRDGSLFKHHTSTNEHIVIDNMNNSSPCLSYFEDGFFLYSSWVLDNLSLRAFYTDSLFPASVCQLNNLAGAPSGRMVMANNNIVYGMQEGCSNQAQGRIFSYDPVSFESQGEAAFWGVNGAFPENNGFTKLSDGTLLGMTMQGGQADSGVIFQFYPGTGGIEVIYEFHKSSGGYPVGHLIQYDDSLFFGATRYGGINNCGAVFKFNILDFFYSDLHHFDVDSGAFPAGSLLLASNKKLYGLTTYGGSNNMGVAYEFDPEGMDYQVILDFDGTLGANPTSSSLVEICSLPEIIQQPDSLTVTQGETTFMCVVVDNYENATFQWYHNNTLIVGATDDTLVFINTGTSDQGEYYCIVTNLCGSITTDTVVLNLLISIHENLINNFILFPNPVKNTLTIHVKDKIKRFSIEIVDIRGKLVLYEGYLNRSEIIINTENLSSGLYFLSITADSGKTIKKFIKR